MFNVQSSANWERDKKFYRNLPGQPQFAAADWERAKIRDGWLKLLQGVFCFPENLSFGS